MGRVTDLLRVPADGSFALSDVDPRSTPGTDVGKRKGRAEAAALGPELADLQERLWAQGRTGGRRRLLLVLQGMDTSGKGGAIKHSVGLVNPVGVRITAFGPPTEEERSHDFLWRVDKALPSPGVIGVFDRSHYEDVLIVRVHDLVPREEWESRYDRINAWEAGLVEDGVVLLKVVLQLSPEEQRRRLLARIDDPTRHWKIDPGDVAERRRWDDYQQAYQAVLQRCSPAPAPWHVVPADRKWYRDWALSHLLLETLQGMDLRWPERPELDLPAMRRALDG